MTVYIVCAKRTPIACFKGAFSHYSATKLGASAIASCVTTRDLQPGAVYMGNVLGAGVGQAPARQASLGAGLAESTITTTVNKVCGSGLKAVELAVNDIRLGNHNLAIGGGMESMTQANIPLSEGRSHLFYDGLTDPYQQQSMLYFAEQVAQRENLSKGILDSYSERSLCRALTAGAGHFSEEISVLGLSCPPLDELPGKAQGNSISTLKPVMPGGLLSAANCSGISDGAAALLLGDESAVAESGGDAMARVVGFSSVARAPAEFLYAPLDAIKQLLDKLNWSADSVELFEVNEAFSIMTYLVEHKLRIPAEKLNVYGGACALGHPIGASGARILVTLVHGLIARDAKRGIAAICIGGGEGMAVAVERG